MAFQKWKDSVASNKHAPRVKMFQLKTSFNMPQAKDATNPMGTMCLRLSIRPYGKKDVRTDILAPFGCLHLGRIQNPGNDEYLAKIRKECDDLEIMAHKAFMALKAPGICPTPSQVIDKMKSMQAPIMITNTFDQVVAEFRQVMANEWSDSSFLTLDNTLAALKRYMNKELHVEQLLIHEITEKFLTRFQLWMRRSGEKTGKGLAPSSVYQYIFKLTQILTFAHQEDYISSNPCDKFSIMNPQADQAPDQLDRKISLADQAKLESTVIPDERLERGRQLMLLQSWTGLAYADLEAQKLRNQVHVGLNGTKEFRYNRVKNGELAIIPVFDETLKILEILHWNHNPGNYRTYLRLVEAVFQYFNIPLADQDGTHTLRHLFGSRMLEKGFSMEAVSRMMGHESIEVTQSIYARVNSEKIHADLAYVKKREAI